jgi:hypothetical protein
LRSRYHGFLTYGANGGLNSFADEASHIGFWPNLDYIGMSGYFVLAQDMSNPSVNDLMESWSSRDAKYIKPLADKYHKQVIFTEVGYRNIGGDHKHPWDWTIMSPVSDDTQRDLYEALIRYWNGKSYFIGVHFWKWEIDPNAWGPQNLDFTPYGKKAEGVLANWFGGQVNPPPTGGNPNPPPDGGPNPPPVTGDVWTITASAQTGVMGNEMTIPVKVSNANQVQDILVDVEIYNNSNNKIFQKFFDHQTISKDNPGKYSVTWTPDKEGKYSVRVGIFTNDWSKNYFWNGGVLKFSG